MDINHEAMMMDIKDGTLCQRGYRFIKHLFYDDNGMIKDEEGINIWREIEKIKLQKFCDLFPNLKRIFIQQIELSGQFMEKIHEFLASKGTGNLKKHKVDEITVYNIRKELDADDDERAMSVDDYVQKYWQQFDD